MTAAIICGLIRLTSRCHRTKNFMLYSLSLDSFSSFSLSHAAAISLVKASPIPCRKAIAAGLVFDGFKNQFLSRSEIEIRTSAAGADNDDFVGLNDNATVKTGSRYRNHHELHRGVFRLCSFSRMREGLLERGF